MKAATMFSGIGAPECAMPDWDWLWHAEIEKFPNAVMAERHPQSINLGDVNAEDFAQRAERAGRPDVLVFGSPCQSFSVAGRRLGLDDARGNLALVALGIVARLKPRWFVFENVPGLLSSAEGRDFGLFLRTVDELGYFGSWAVLDAQYAGLAQRRERLFFVGHSGDWRRAAAVLFEPEGLCGYYPPSRSPGKGTAVEFAPSLTASGRGVERTGESRGQDPVVAVSPDIAGAVSSKWSKGTGGPAGDECYNLVSDPIQANEARTYSTAGNNPRPRNVVAVPIAFDTGKDGAPSEAMAPLSADADKGDQDPVLLAGTAVRRLTPRECERLQGFPDNYTLVNFRGKPAADGPRYRALGNSMAAPVIRWILNRIEQLDKMP